MAKHPHRLMLVDNKTWRCTLSGCTFFVHVGLQYILPGKNAQCWECDETFTLDERALKDEMPKCSRCRGEDTSVNGFDIEAYLAEQLKKREAEKQATQSIASDHLSDCGIHLGLECDCKVNPAS